MGALDGLRVVDIGLLVQGPQAAGMLCDMGADVIKVELPDVGDQSRWVVLSGNDRRAPYYVACNRGKRSITVDARKAAGVEVVHRLVETADVIVSNFAAGTMDGWGIGYDDLAAVNPRLIYAAGTVMGAEGPDSGRKGADLAAQAMGGLIATTGTDADDATPVGVTIADHVASQNMVAGILAALYARERTGVGQRVETSLVGGQIYAQASEYTAYFMTGQQPGRARGGHPLVHTFYGVVPTADGHVAMVGAHGRGRAALFSALGRPEWADNPDYMARALDPAVRTELFAELASVMSARPTAEWLSDLAGHRVYEVRDYAAAASDAQNHVNGYLIDTEHPQAGAKTIVGTPVRLDATPSEVDPSVPELGQHTEEILLEIGYDRDDIGRFRQLGAI
jgi:crotonobetainyl-CoA:carnitine CoA-transferase CaiB-like acyl-CoA transferase